MSMQWGFKIWINIWNKYFRFLLNFAQNPMSMVKIVILLPNSENLAPDIHFQTPKPNFLIPFESSLET